MCCYTNIDITKYLKKYITGSPFKKFFEETYFVAYTGMQKFNVQAQMQKDSSLSLILIEPNRLVVQYFGGEKTISKANLVDKFEKKNIMPNARGLSLLNLSSSFVEPRSATLVVNATDDPDDNFMDDPPHIPITKDKSIITHPSANDDEVTSLSVQRARRPVSEFRCSEGCLTAVDVDRKNVGFQIFNIPCYETGTHLAGGLITTTASLISCSLLEPAEEGELGEILSGRLGWTFPGR
ncbi:hypothetical protein HAX54_011851 [Datura stramonium]|uniref:Uncharacterized protein n=1 Tax=Datura stramonium TaxID=4076 RepID=A0ABS8RXE9_DATST|nr:hypothetical protein [Datura stramonium]